MLEEKVEDYLRRRVDVVGGICVKLHPKGYKGIPDRLVILPGHVVFVELKRPRGGVLARLQSWWRHRLHALGHDARVISTQDAVDDLLRELGL